MNWWENTYIYKLFHFLWFDLPVFFLQLRITIENIGDDVMTALDRLVQVSNVFVGSATLGVIEALPDGFQTVADAMDTTITIYDSVLHPIFTVLALFMNVPFAGTVMGIIVAVEFSLAAVRAIRFVKGFILSA